MAETPYERSPGYLWRTQAVVRARAIVFTWPVALALILLLGAALRFHDLGWDQPDGAPAPLQMHPDERFLSLVSDRLQWPSSLGGYFDTSQSPLNPYNDPETHSFVYGTFPLFLAKGVSTVTGHLPGEIGIGPLQLPLPNGHGDPPGPGNSYDNTVVWGRLLTAFTDTATIAVVFALGTVLFGRKAGLLAALLYALSVLPTQLAHFWTMDPFLTFFGALTLLQACLFAGSKRSDGAWYFGVGAGLTLGLAAACKVNAAVMLPVIPLAAAVRIGLRDYPALGLRWRGERLTPTVAHRDRLANWLTDLAVVCFSLAVALVVFRIAQPYAFTGPHFWDMSINPQWREDLHREYDFQNGSVDYPPFVQFAGRAPFIAPLQNMVLWGLGPALGIAAWMALAAGVVVMFRRRELVFVLPLAFAGAIFAFQGMRFVAFMRYFEPMYPVLCVFAGWGVVTLWQAANADTRRQGWLEQRSGPLWSRLRGIATRRNLRWGAGIAIGALFVATAWWAMAFQGIYGRDNPRIVASEWIYANVPAGSTLTSELWDDSLPYPLPNKDFSAYRGIETEPYQTDSQQKITELVYGRPKDNGKGGLNNADYVVISSNRVKESVQKLEREYPATIRYYELLDSGALGFEPVASFSSHPAFLGISIDDSSAEESFTVYDHPEVRIYKKTAEWDPQRALALLDEAHPERAVNLLPKQGRTNGLQFTPAEAQAQQKAGTFADIFDADGLTSHVPWFWWLAWLELAAFAALPWVTWLFRALPDRGYGLSKILGLCAVVVPTCLLVAWGGPAFSSGLVWMVFGIALSAGIALGFVRRRALLEHIREQWRTWLTMECVFLAAFGAFLLLRYFNPDLWHDPQGGEKPMEIAYLTAVTKSTHLPPYDPWFAGGSINYYYMGWFFMAVPIRALRLVPEVAFNLGIPTFAALGAAVAVSTGHNLVALAARSNRVIGERVRDWRRPAIFAGIFAVILLLGMANLDGALQTIEHVQSVNEWNLASGVPVIGGAIGILGGLWQMVFHGASLPPFDWWRSSRVHFGQIDITEFPFWSLLFGDLHPHVMDVPFFGLVIALAVAYTVTVRAHLRVQSWVLAALIGMVVGLIRTIHTWDFPTAIVIGFGGIAAGQVLVDGRWQQRWWNGVMHGALAAAVLVVAFAPYTAHFETFDPGLIRSPETTKAHQYFIQFGIFVAFAVAFLAVRYREELRGRLGCERLNPVLASVNGWLELGALGIFLAGLIAFTWPFGLTTIALGVVFEIYLFNLLWLELRADERNVGRALATAMFALAFGISVGVDIVTLKNDVERMNTVFKFSLQAWQLFALASAFAAWYVGRAVWDVRGWHIQPRARRQSAALAGTSVIGLLLIGSSIFLFAGTAARQDTRFASTPPTLNGLAFLQQAKYREVVDPANPARTVTIKLEDDEPLIRWLRANVKGSPVITEAVGPIYHWTGRISEYTGLPTVIGWDWHQIQQRTEYSGLVDQRRADTTRFYSDANIAFAEQYLLRYNVSYVIVGTEEHARGTPGGLDKFARMPALSEVFRSGENVIYRVDQSKLPPPE